MCNAATLSPGCAYNGDDFLLRRWHLCRWDSKPSTKTDGIVLELPMHLPFNLAMGIAIVGCTLAYLLTFTFGSGPGRLSEYWSPFLRRVFLLGKNSKQIGEGP
jgi:hypothetical protein